MWDLIYNPLITLMTWMYSIFNRDIVLAIVGLTVLIRLATFPLTLQQQRSTQKMQEVQPQLKKLQEKYKDDREKLSQAQMELYRTAGVNPLAGCFPLLIQLPILIGLYQAIAYALANSPFQLVDLSQRLLIPGLDSLIPLQNVWLGMNLTQPPTPPVNPTYALVLPALVAATTYFQFKMTVPANSDPNDQAASMNRSMSTIMPLMFGMLSLSFSVGLSIYFIVSNLMGIAQYSAPGKRLVERLTGISMGGKPIKVTDNVVVEAVSSSTSRPENKKTPKTNTTGKSYGGTKKNTRP